jgi:predicted ABC-type ATPase
MTDEQISRIAVKLVKSNPNWKRILAPFCDKTIYLPAVKPATVLMAGCTGAGKTEFSKRLLAVETQLPITKKYEIKKYVRADPDEFYVLLKNELKLSGDFRSELNYACIKLVEKLADTALHNRQNLLIDSSFSQEKALTNIERSLLKKRTVHIYFIYELPKIAWNYVLKRQKLEGRKVTKDFFIQTYLGSIETVKKAVARYGNKIIVDVYQKGDDANQDILIPQFKKLCHINSLGDIDKIIGKQYNQEGLSISIQ